MFEKLFNPVFEQMEKDGYSLNDEKKEDLTAWFALTILSNLEVSTGKFQDEMKQEVFEKIHGSFFSRLNYAHEDGNFDSEGWLESMCNFETELCNYIDSVPEEKL